MTEKNCFVLRDAIYNSIIRHFYIKQLTADAGHEPQEKLEYCGIIDMFIIPPTETDRGDQIKCKCARKRRCLFVKPQDKS